MINEIVRCGWVGEDPQMIAYHDDEWGQPVHDDNRHFEMLTLEGAQAGLSWSTILNKRENYVRLFEGFDPARVARFDETRIAALLLDAGIIRNRLKVNSTVSNAGAFIDVQEEFGSFDTYVWRFVDGAPIVSRPSGMSDFQTSTPESDALSEDLKSRGFRFIGTTIIYAYMQAVGLVDDHMAGCFRR